MRLPRALLAAVSLVGIAACARLVDLDAVTFAGARDASSDATTASDATSTEDAPGPIDAQPDATDDAPFVDAGAGDAATTLDDGGADAFDGNTCPTVPVAGAVAFWPLDDRMGSTARNCVPGSPLSPASLSANTNWDDPMDGGNSLQFNYSSYASITTAGDSGVPGVNEDVAFSITAFVNVSAFTTASQSIVGVVQGEGETDLWSLWALEPGGPSEFAFGNGVTDVLGTNSMVQVWTHLAATYDPNPSGTPVAMFYMNGSLTGSGTLDLSHLTNGSQFSIGGFMGPAYPLSTALVRDVILFDHVLTPADVAKVCGCM